MPGPQLAERSPTRRFLRTPRRRPAAPTAAARGGGRRAARAGRTPRGRREGALALPLSPRGAADGSGRPTAPRAAQEYAPAGRARDRVSRARRVAAAGAAERRAAAPAAPAGRAEAKRRRALPSFLSIPPFLPSARSLVALRPDSCSGDGTSSRVLPEVPQLRGVEAQLVAAARLQPAGDGSAAGRGGPLPSLGGARSGSARRGPSRGFSGCLFAPLRRGKAWSGSGGLRSFGGRGAAERRWC